MTIPQFKLKTIFCLILLIAVAFAVDFLFFHSDEYFCRKRTSLLNKDVVCSDEKISPQLVKDIRPKLIKELAAFKQQGLFDRFSVSYRDLKNGPTFGIDEYGEYIPASLLKLPMALTYTSIAETEPEILNQKIKALKLEIPLQNIKPLISAKENQSYSVKELIKLVLENSDNASYQILFNYIMQSPQRQEVKKKIFHEYGFSNSDDPKINNLNTRVYLSTFRRLYNGVAPNQELSELILSCLQKSQFNDGIKKYLPTNVAVAHKFGERDLGARKQLHDCGIVYHREYPYLVCMMTEGDNLEELSEVIAQISKLIYEWVDEDIKKTVLE